MGPVAACPRRKRESVSSDVTGRRMAAGRVMQAGGEGTAGPGVDGRCAEAPAEVLEFIRHCYRRRGIGWPELYDEMCAAAARGSYRGMDYDALAELGIGFSITELPRLAALAQRVVTEERAARTAAARRAAVGDDRVGESSAGHPQDDARRARTALFAASTG